MKSKHPLSKHLRTFWERAKIFLDYYNPYAAHKWIKYTLLFVIALIALWMFILKCPMYQWIYGKPHDKTLVISQSEYFGDITGPTPPTLFTLSDYAVRMKFLKTYAATAKIVYVDRYNMLGTWYRSSDASFIYDTIVPLDISTVSGPTAHPDTLKKFKFSHDYRGLWTTPLTFDAPYSNIDINNNHIIPATDTVAKGLAVLSRGDTATLEGYLVDLQGMGKYNWWHLRSALEPGEISKQKAGGRRTGLCRIIFLTRLIFNGRVYE